MADWHSIPNASDHLKWYQNKGALKLNFFLSIIFAGMILNGYDGTVVSRLQALPVWYTDLGFDPDAPDGVRLGFLNAVGFFSGLVVGPFITWVDDTFGRKWGIRFYAYTMLLGTVVGTCAGLPGVNGYALFVAGRAIIGLGLASFLMTSLIVVQEISHPRTRRAVAQSWDSYWILGSVIASLLIFGTGYIQNSWAWRIPYIVQIPFAVYLLIAVQFCPETPRFLLAHGRDQEALQFLIDYHGNGNPNDELVLFEFEEMKTKIALEREASEEKWSTIIKSRGSRKRLGLAALMTFLTSLSGSSIVYFYYTTVLNLVGITDTTTQTGLGVGLSAWTYIVQIVAVFVGKRVGCKPIILIIWPLLLLCLVGLCVSGGVFQNGGQVSSSAGVATVVMLWAFLTFFNFSNPVLYSYPAEIQTYSTRSKGLLVWNSVNQVMGAYATWVDAIALTSIGYKYYIVYMPLLVIQWFLAKRYMVETRGLTLEQIATAFDGPDAIVTPVDRLHEGGLDAVRRSKGSHEEGEESVDLK